MRATGKQSTPDKSGGTSDRVPAHLVGFARDDARSRRGRSTSTRSSATAPRGSSGPTRATSASSRAHRTPIMTLNNLAGKKPEEFSLNVRKLDEQRAGAWDPAERIKDMDIDGVDAEVLYVGGPLMSADSALRLNSVRGYNRWLSDFASYAPDRLLGRGRHPDRHARAGRRGDPLGGRATRARERLHPAVPARGRLRRRSSGIRCGRRSSTPACRSVCTWAAAARAPRSSTSTRARPGS